MNTDDKKAILEELEAAWGPECPEEDIHIANQFKDHNDMGDWGKIRYWAATMYLAAKRKYQQPVSATGEVRTSRTFEEWDASQGRPNVASGEGLTDLIRAAWRAALASVISTSSTQGGKRFEVGDEATANYTDGLHRGLIGFVPNDKTNRRDIFDPSIVRPLPQTVELTVEDKLNEVVGKVGSLRLIASELANGKTLDELCEAYGVETTRSV